jgi:hypothetical protein
MPDPISLQEIFYSTASGAAIVLFGAAYALFLALGRLHGSRLLTAASIISYLLLAAAVGVLILALHLAGFWLLVASVMLVGYFFVPRAIWNLCAGTHGLNDAEIQPRPIQ